MTKDGSRPYFRVSAELMQDSSLTFEARGMMGYLLSRPDDWTVLVPDLIKSSPSGAAKTRRIIKELVERGFLVREWEHEKGQFSFKTDLYEVADLNPQCLL